MKDGMTAAALRSQYAAETANGAGYIWGKRVQVLKGGKAKKSGGNKAVLALLLALVLVLVGSAAFFLIITRDGGAESGAAQSESVKPGKKGDKDKEERPEREDLFDDDGEKTGYRVFEYDETGRVVSQEDFDLSDVTVRRWEYTYSDDGSETETRFYWHGEYTSRWIDYYGKDGIRTEQRSYNAEDALTEICRCDDEGNLIVRELYQGPAGAEWKFSEDELDEQGRPTKSEFFTETGEPDGSYIVEYNEEGLESRSVYYNADGEFMWDYRSEYDRNGNCVRREEYDENGALVGYEVMEYNEDGKLQRRMRYDGEDVLESYTVTEFGPDGRPIREQDYDGEDNPTYYTEYVYAEDGSYDCITYRSDGTEIYRMSYDADGYYIG